MKSNLKDALKRVNDTFGKGSVMKLNEKIEGIKANSTGSLLLDIATGIGGWAKGRIIELFGWESSGKSTLATLAVAEVQKKGGVGLYVDVEHAFDKDYAEKLGVDIENLLVSQPDSGEDALEILDMLLKSGEIDIAVVDSVSALTPKAELEGAMGDAKMGLQSRLMSQACRKLIATINKTGATVIFINQFRQKIGVMFGDPRTTSGGNALKFYSSMRGEVSKGTLIKEKGSEQPIGALTKVKIIKNKCASPYTTAEFRLIYGKGIDTLSEIIDICVDKNIIKRSGSWYSYGETKLGQGVDGVKKILNDNPELVEELKQKALKS